MVMVKTKVLVGDEYFHPKKQDPTQYDKDADAIHIRPNYDILGDPAGWLVHEYTHALHRDLDDDGLDYPSNNIERLAYVEQFRYLKNKGHKFEDIFKIPTMEHKKDHIDILRKYWDEA